MSSATRCSSSPALAHDARFASNSRRTAHRARSCARSIVDAFAPLTAAQVIARLDAAQIANARMNDMGDVWAHPQLRARERWVEVATPAGPVPALLPPGHAAAIRRRAWTRCPRSAQHTDAILRELGYDAGGDRARCARDKAI